MVQIIGGYTMENTKEQQLVEQFLLLGGAMLSLEESGENLQEIIPEEIQRKLFDILDQNIFQVMTEEQVINYYKATIIRLVDEIQEASK